MRGHYAESGRRSSDNNEMLFSTKYPVTVPLEEGSDDEVEIFSKQVKKTDPWDAVQEKNVLNDNVFYVVLNTQNNHATTAKDNDEQNKTQIVISNRTKTWSATYISSFKDKNVITVEDDLEIDHQGLEQATIEFSAQEITFALVPHLFLPKMGQY
ncbi:hypothetical protein G6F57_004821 [Rhizopus arrhizus]|nr:hypothetical protein G6F22_008700 [Rhizopus arrhizus]KAG1402981.1 hypothetical protein G6F58_010461 [Rhizopus delemar]KAG0794278.1 hypothetical protein G6F21_002988 [Rhizopus arrhizus]KAG0813412.1 hypothetical protein G6F20_005589 [Rhizopus arrhizus]KAG0827274.1 hypothetical protein G6F19_008870 [Rhizopus arrhizus]